MNYRLAANIATLTGLLIAISAPVVYADLKEDVLALCDKIEACVLEQVESQNLPPQVKELLANGIFDKQCTQALQKYETNVADSGLENEAQACVGSLLEQDCAALIESANGNQSEECTAFEKAANEAGVDLGQ